MNEIKIRKQWLALLVIIPIWNFAFNLMYIQSDPSVKTMPAWFVYCNTVFVLFSPLVFNYILYYCAFKKPGTKLLTFVLIFTPISFALMIGVYVFGTVPLPNFRFFELHMAVASVLSIWWYVLNWKLRQLNKIQNQVLLS